MDQPNRLCGPASLIAACCRWPMADNDAEYIASEIAKIEDWNALFECAQRHRVITQLLLALKDQPTIPTEFLEKLRRAAMHFRKLGLLQLAQLQRLQGLLQSNDIPFAEIKGNTLGQLAYGRTDIKQSVDIDLLVLPQDADGSLSLLLANGYSHEFARKNISSRQVEALVNNRKDIALSGPHGIKLELHWQLIQGRGLLNGVAEPSSWQSVELPGAKGKATTGATTGPMNGAMKMQTLATPDLIAYLAVHGALSDWGRLKWLSDFNALLAGATKSQLNAYLVHADRVGAGICLRYALALCRDVFGRKDIAEIQDLAADPELVMAGMTALQAPYPPSARTFREKLRILLSNLRTHRRLYQRPAQARAILRPYLFVESDILAHPLPSGLRYLYPLMRLPIWLATRVFSQS